MSQPWTDDEIAYLRECPRCREYLPSEHYVTSSALCRVCRGVARMRPMVTTDSWPTPRHREPWTHDEDCYLSDNVGTNTYADIARHLGRSLGSVIARAAKTHNTPMQAGLLTTAELAELLGCSVQYVARLARSGQIPARRVPGGRTWLYPLEVAGTMPDGSETVSARIKAFRRQAARHRLEQHWNPDTDWTA